LPVVLHEVDYAEGAQTGWRIHFESRNLLPPPVPAELRPRVRLIVVDSPLRSASFCEWLAEPLGDKAAAIAWFRRFAWQEREYSEPFPALTEAIRLIRAGHLPPG
jgi:hypothetical protein